MQTSPTAPKQTLLPHDRGGQLALLPTGEDGGSNGQRRAHASSSGHVTQTKAKMATATTANLTERAAGETESLATVVAAVEMEGAKRRRRRRPAQLAGGSRWPGSASRTRESKLRHDVLAAQQVVGMYTGKRINGLLLPAITGSTPAAAAPAVVGAHAHRGRIRWPGCCRRQTVRYPHHTTEQWCSAMRYTPHGSTARHPLTPAG